MKEKISMAADAAVKKETVRLSNLSDMVGVLSPSNTLRRGYSITRVDGKAVSDASNLKPGQTIETQLDKGKIISVVK